MKQGSSKTILVDFEFQDANFMMPARCLCTWVENLLFVFWVL